MDNKVIKATRRSVTGKQVKALRRQGLLPAVMYGTGIEPIAISMDARETSRILAGLSSSTIVTIDINGEQHAALVRDRQRNYLKGSLLHIDFQVVSLTEKIRASVQVETTGEAPAVREHDAVIVNNTTVIEVLALPGDLPERITVDLSVLAEVGSAIYVRDLNLSDKVEILTSGDEILVLATAAAPEEVEEEVVAEEDLSEPDVIERGKKEEGEEEEENE